MTPTQLKSAADILAAAKVLATENSVDLHHALHALQIVATTTKEPAAKPAEKKPTPDTKPA